MTGGTISGNKVGDTDGSEILENGQGGGVRLANSTTSTPVNFTMSDGTISGNSAYDGAGVYMMNDSIFTMSGGTISENTATNNGGGVYQISTGELTMSGGTVNGNTVAENGKGAGVYLAEGTTLNLSGAPDFGGSGLDDDGKIIVEKTVEGETVATGNFVTGTLNDATNGQADYTQYRQDIYVAGYLEMVSGASTTNPATSIVVTGEIASGDGSIWVACEVPSAANENNHYYMLKQFAVFADGVTPTEASYTAFRNAWDDETSGCGADYLTGQDGDDLTDEAGNTWKCLYWTGGFDFLFRKIDSFGESLDGATFTLYKSNDEETDILTESDTKIAYQISDGGEKKDVTATSAEIAQEDAVEIKYTTDAGATVDKADIYGNLLH